MANMLKWIPIDQQLKQRIIATNILPAGLYGIEASNYNKDHMEKLRVAITKIIGPSGYKRNVDLAFNNAASSKDLDPLTHTTYNRVALIRRHLSKFDASHHLAGCRM